MLSTPTVCRGCCMP